MTRFVTYDPEVASRLAQAVGLHRVELRDASTFKNTITINPALQDLIRAPKRSSAMMASSDEQVLIVRVNEDTDNDVQSSNRRKKHSKQNVSESEEIGSRPSGFLGLHDQSVFSDEEEDPPRSLWKKDEE
jgi:hypothetical protein